MRVYERFEVSGAHRLSLPYESKCRNLHGHNYIIEVWVEGEKNSEGMVVDFTKLKSIVMSLDHRFLNDVLGVNPTAENMAEWIAKRILEEGDFKVRVRVWEDRDSYAEFESE